MEKKIGLHTFGDTTGRVSFLFFILMSGFLFVLMENREVTTEKK